MEFYVVIPITLATLRVSGLFLSTWRKRSHRPTKDKTWVTGKQMPATVSTADTAKNNLENCAEMSHRYRQQGNYKVLNKDQIQAERTGEKTSIWRFCVLELILEKSRTTWQAKWTKKSKVKREKTGEKLTYSPRNNLLLFRLRWSVWMFSK